MKTDRIDCRMEVPYTRGAKAFPRGVAHPLYYTAEEVDRARERVKRFDWAKLYLDGLVRSIEGSGILGMSDEAIRGEISEQATFPLPRCPVDRGQRSWRDTFWTWSPDDRPHVRCNTCGTVFPEPEQEPTGTLEVIGPAGGSVSYPYWEDEEGFRYHFSSFVNFYRQNWTTGLAPTLARAFVLTGEQAFARKAAVILQRLAEVYPNYPVHGFGRSFGGADNQGFFENHFYTERPYPFVSSRWANYYSGPYVDAANVLSMAEAYDLVFDSGAFDLLSEDLGQDVAGQIERDLLHEAACTTLDVKRLLTNYQGRFIMALGLIGRLLGEQRFVDEAWQVYRDLIDNCFHYDGFWCEDTLNYFGMIVGSVLRVPELLSGSGGIDVSREMPFLPRIYTAPLGLHFPDGSTFPVNDTWSETLRPGARRLASMGTFIEAADELAGDGDGPVVNAEYALFRRSRVDDRTVADADLLAHAPENTLLPGAGDAALGVGRGPEALRATLYFGPWGGHHHHDTLALGLYAHGEELLSDIGYTGASTGRGPHRSPATTRSWSMAWSNRPPRAACWPTSPRQTDR